MKRVLKYLFTAVLGLLLLSAAGLWVVGFAWPRHVDARFQERCHALRPGMTPDEARAWMPPGWGYSPPKAGVPGPREVGKIAEVPLQPVDGGALLVWSHSNHEFMHCRRFTCVISFDVDGGHLTGSELNILDLGCD